MLIGLMIGHWELVVLAFFALGIGAIVFFLVWLFRSSQK